MYYGFAERASFEREKLLGEKLLLLAGLGLRCKSAKYFKYMDTVGKVILCTT